jgi:hypothetical protein
MPPISLVPSVRKTNNGNNANGNGAGAARKVTLCVDEVVVADIIAKAAADHPLVKVSHQKRTREGVLFLVVRVRWSE